jgi:hypothetical protein
VSHVGQVHHGFYGIAADVFQGISDKVSGEGGSIISNARRPIDGWAARVHSYNVSFSLFQKGDERFFVMRKGIVDVKSSLFWHWNKQERIKYWSYTQRNEKNQEKIQILFFCFVFCLPFYGLILLLSFQ